MRSFSLVLVIGLAGCGSGLSTPPMMVQKAIGASGGQVTATDGTQITFPSGALLSDTVVTITPALKAPSPASAQVVGNSFSFGPEGASFAKPVTVTLSFDPGKLPSGKTAANVVIYTAPTGSAAYSILEATVADTTHVTATTNHFSTFVSGVPVEAPGCTVSCGPNDGGCQCRATCDGKVYSISCSELGACFCTVDGKEKSVVEIPGCETAGEVQKAYSRTTNGCGFPGTLG